MKNVYSKKSLFLSLLLIIGLSFSLSAQKAQKTISRSYNVNKTFDLQVDNKFGDIKVLNWTKDVVDVQVEIIVEAPSQTKAEDILKGIDVAISEGIDLASFKTKFGDDGGWGKNTEVQVNYTISLPVRVGVDLKNKYGDLFIQSLTGKAVIDVAYGSLKAESLGRGNEEPVNSLNLAYSNGTVENCNVLNVNLAYSDLTVGESKTLLVDSRYSKLYTTRGESLTIDGKYDKYGLGVLGSLIIKTRYSSISVEKLSKLFEMDAAYTNTKIGTIASSVTGFKALAEYGNIKAGMEKGASFQVTGSARYGSLSFPEGSGLDVKHDEANETVSGKLGDGKGKMEIDMRYGNAELR